MRKTDRKIENAIITALTDVCEDALEQVPGFRWLTHTVNYNNFPDSLQVTCVFDDELSLETARQSGDTDRMCHVIQDKLNKLDIYLTDINQNVKMETEASYKRRSIQVH